MSGEMGTTPEYEALTISLSLLAVVLALFYLWRVGGAYKTFHDERAAVSLGKAVGFLVISFGLLVSSLAYLTEAAVLSIAGLSIARGALITVVATLLLANVRPGHRDSEGDPRPPDTMTRRTDTSRIDNDDLV